MVIQAKVLHWFQGTRTTVQQLCGPRHYGCPQQSMHAAFCLHHRIRPSTLVRPYVSRLRRSLSLFLGVQSDGSNSCRRPDAHWHAARPPRRRPPNPNQLMSTSTQRRMCLDVTRPSNTHLHLQSYSVLRLSGKAIAKTPTRKAPRTRLTRVAVAFPARSHPRGPSGPESD